MAGDRHQRHVVGVRQRRGSSSGPGICIRGVAAWAECPVALHSWP